MSRFRNGPGVAHGQCVIPAKAGIHALKILRTLYYSDIVQSESLEEGVLRIPGLAVFFNGYCLVITRI